MSSKKSNQIAFLSTYPPREGGLATFTQDLVRQLNGSHSKYQSRVIAVCNKNLQYNDEVMMVIEQNDIESYKWTAQKLNYSDIKLLVIEHEFGIFGGEQGEYLLDFINNIQLPFITTLHTVPSAPDAKQQQILSALGQKSRKIVTMSKDTVDILKNVYGIDPLKIAVIDHGVTGQASETGSTPIPANVAAQYNDLLVKVLKHKEKHRKIHDQRRPF